MLELQPPKELQTEAPPKVPGSQGLRAGRAASGLGGGPSLPDEDRPHPLGFIYRPTRINLFGRCFSPVPVSFVTQTTIRKLWAANGHHGGDQRGVPINRKQYERTHAQEYRSIPGKNGMDGRSGGMGQQPSRRWLWSWKA